MSDLPAGIEVVETAEGPYRTRRYRLPPRTMPGVGCTIMGGLLAIGLTTGIPVGFGLFFYGGAAGLDPALRLAGFLCPVGFFGSFLFPVAIYVLLRIVFIHTGRLEIVVERQQLLLMQGWGILRWTRRLPLRGLRGLRVVTERPFNPSDPQFSQDLSKVGSLLADYQGGSQKTLCWGYPAPWLEQFSQALTADFARQPGLAEPVLPATRESEFPAEIAARRSQPSNSNALVRHEGDQLVIELPRPGLWRCVHPVFLIFCLVWNGLLAMFTVMLAIITALAWTGQVPVENPEEQGPIWALALFQVPFHAIGIVSLGYWLGMARRWTRIQVGSGRLQVVDHRLWRTTTTEWPAAEIVSIAAVSRRHEKEAEDGDPRFAEVTWSYGLAIEPRQGAAGAFLEWRSRSELEWLATLLRQRLGLPEPTQHPGAEDRRGIQ